MAHKCNNNGKSDLELLCLKALEGELEEIAATIPSLLNHCEAMRLRVDSSLCSLYNTIKKVRDVASQKEFALMVQPEPLKAALFDMKKTNDWDIKNYFGKIAKLLTKDLSNEELLRDVQKTP